MRIFQIVMFLTQRRGGASTFLHTLSQELIKIGHTATILTTGFEPDDDYAREIRSKGVPENLIFLGFVTEREKRATLVDADVFVTPRTYGFPAIRLVSRVTSLLMNPGAKEIAEDAKECYL